MAVNWSRIVIVFHSSFCDAGEDVTQAIISVFNEAEVEYEDMNLSVEEVFTKYKLLERWDETLPTQSFWQLDRETTLIGLWVLYP